MSSEGLQQNNLEQLPKLSERYDILLQEIIKSKNPELLKPLLKLNEELQNSSSNALERMEKLNRKLSDDEIKEFQYMIGSRFQNAKVWIGFVNNYIEEIQSAAPEDDVSKFWESIIADVNYALEDLRSLDI